MPTWIALNLAVVKLPSEQVALTVLDDPRGNLNGWKSRREWRFGTIDVCARGVHAGVGDLHGALVDLKRTVDDILEGR